MKRFITIALLITIASAFCLPVNAQVLWRGAKTMKKGSYISMVHWYYMDFTNKYIVDDWKDNPKDQVNWGFNYMFGYAVTDRFEAMVHIPYAFLSQEDDDGKVEEAGFGDMWLKARLGLLPWAKDKHGFTLTATLKLPTGAATFEPPEGKEVSDYKFCKLGKGRTDFALGGIYSSPWRYKFRAHLKANYWFNENNSTKSTGDSWKLIVKLDRNFHKKFMGFATYIHTAKWADKNSPDGAFIDNTDKKRHIFQVGGVYKPKKGVFVRPKVAFAIGGEKLINYDFKPMLDVWYVFTI